MLDRDLWATPARISDMPLSRWRHFSAALLAAALLAAAAMAGPARADVGVESVSRSAGAPGEQITLMIGCGACYPPCPRDPRRLSGVCAPGPGVPPAAFPVSLVPVEQAPRPYRCGPNVLCTPRAPAPPRRTPFAFLGKATPLADDGGLPSYRLRFDVPDLRPGAYAFVIFCDACVRGEAGSLIAQPRDRLWRLRVLPVAVATFRASMSGW